MNKQQKIDELNLKISELCTELSNLKKELWLEKFNNKDYITDLSAYKDQNLLSIRAFSVDGKEVYIPTDENVFVDDSGRLKATSYASGVLEYDNEADCYVHFFNGSMKVLDIVGFTDIVVG